MVLTENHSLGRSIQTHPHYAGHSGKNVVCEYRVAKEIATLLSNGTHDNDPCLGGKCL